jgi:HEAT repeat protein
MPDQVAEQIAALQDKDWGVREDAAVILGQCGDPRGVRPLIEALRDSDRAVREAATTALSAIGEPAVLDLANCLRDSNLSVQEAAASVLSTIADERVVDPLISALVNEDWVVRMYAAKALGRLKVSQATSTLVLLLQDKVKAVRDEAIMALQVLEESAVTTLLPSLQDKNWSIRLRAVEALGLLGSSLAVSPLMDVLSREEDTTVKQDVIWALGEIGDARAIDLLVQAMKETRLRSLAIEALGKIGDPVVIPHLLEALEDLRDADFEDRVPTSSNDQFEQQLVPMEAAIKALARIRDPQTIPVFLSALKSTLVRTEASEALGGFGRSIIPHLLEYLKTEKDENIRYHVKETLTKVGWKPRQVRM